MKSVELRQFSNDREPVHERPYVAPSFRQLSPQEAKELLLRDPANASDSVVQAMLAQIDKILATTGSK